MKPGIIYVIGTAWGAPVKVGVASDIARRLATLQAGNPLALQVFWVSPECEDVYAVESHLHRSFADCLVRGEWFAIPALDLIVDSFGAFRGRRYGAKTQQTLAAVACGKAVTALVDRISLVSGVTIETGIAKFAQDYGFSRKTVWRLRYKPPVDVFMDDYERVAKAVWAECGRDFGLLVCLPDPESIFEAVDFLSSRSIYESASIPSQDFRQNLRARDDRYDRMVELTALLQGSR